MFMNTAASLHFFERIRREGCSWGALHEEIASIPDMDAIECLALAAAYHDLEALVGEAFFTQRHPIANWAWESGAWSRRRFVQLAAMLKRRGQEADYTQLCANLQHVKKAAETLDVLEWWDRLALAGCEVQYEPPLLYKHGTADLLIVAPQECYVELSELETGATRGKHNELRALVMDVIFNAEQPLLFAGKTIAGMPRSRRTDITARLLALRHVAEGGFLATMEHPDFLHLGLAPLALQSELAAWAAARALDIGNLTTQPIPELEDWRLRRKIEEKSVQLPPGKAGVLLLYSYEIYLQYARIPAVLSFLENELRNYPQISALILRGLYFPQSPDPLRLTHEGHRIIAYSNGRHWECTLLLYNRIADCSLPATLSERLEATLVQGINDATVERTE